LSWIFKTINFFSDNAAEVPTSSSKSAIPSDFFDSAPKAPVAKAEKRNYQNKKVPRQVKNANPASG